MAGVNILVRADSSGYQSAMKAARLETQKLASEYNLASSKAKLLGSASKELKEKAKSLTEQIKVQNDITKVSRERQEKLGETLASQKKTQADLTTQIDKAKKAYEDQAKATGEDSNEAKALKDELNKLEKQQGDLTREIDRTEDQLTKATAATNNSQAAANKLEKELKDTKKAIQELPFDKIIEGLDKAGKKMVDFGKKMTTHVTLPIVAAFTAAGKSAIDFEHNFANVMKTNDEVVDSNGNVVYSYDELRQGILDMSTEIPASTAAISEVAEAAGMLGIKTENVLDFTRVMIDLGNVTNLSADQAASSLAKFMNITGLSQDEVDKLGSTIVYLGNNFATTQVDIVNMGTRLAAAGSQIGMTDAEIMGLATALSSLGLEAQAGGSAFSKIMKQMAVDVETGSGNIENFAEVAGMSVADFSELFRTDATSALTAFIAGLGDTEAMGMSTIVMLDEMGITELRMSDALMRTSNASELLTDAIQGGRDAWEENNAMASATEAIYNTTAAKLEITKGKLAELAISIGDRLLPPLNNLLDKVAQGVEWFGNLDDKTQTTIMTIAGVAAAIGPVISIVGKLTQGVSGITRVVKLLFTTVMAHPVIAIITAIIGSLVLLYNNCEGFRNFVDGAVAKVKEVFGKLVEGFKGAVEAIKGFFSGFKETVGNIMGAAKDVVSEKLNNIKSAYEENGGGIKGIAAAAMEGVKGYWTAGLSFVDKLTGGKLSELKDKFVEKMQAVKDAVSEKLQAVKDAFANIFESIKNVVMNVFETIKNVITVAVMAIKEIFSAAFQIITLPFRLIWENCKDLVLGAFTAIKETVSNALEAVREKITNIWNGIVTFLEPLLTGISNFFTNIWNAITTTVSGALEGIRNFFSEKLNAAKEIASTALEAVKGFFTEKLNAAKETASNALENVKGFFSEKLNAARETTSNALEAVRGFFSSKLEAAKSVASSALEAVRGHFSTKLEAAKTLTSTALESVKGFFSEKLNAAKSTASTVLDSIKSAFTDKMNAARDGVSSAIEKIKGFFNFEWSLPSLKMPHFSITGSFSLNPPSVPSFGIEWYAKGGIMTAPMLFGVNGSNMMGGGEAGPEAILPLEPFYRRLAHMLDEHTANAERVVVLVESKTYVGNDEVASAVTTKVSQNMAKDYKKRR